MARKYSWKAYGPESKAFALVSELDTAIHLHIWPATSCLTAPQYFCRVWFTSDPSHVFSTIIHDGDRRSARERAERLADEYITTRLEARRDG